MGVSINVPAQTPNYSSLLSSMDSSADWLSDYASIKNGSYGKLMKSYYSELKTDAVNAGSSAASTAGRNRSSKNILEKLEAEKKAPKVSKAAEKSNTALTTGLSSLQSSVAALRDSNTFTDTAGGLSAADKTLSAVKSYVKDYNSVVTAAKGSTLSSKTAYVSNIMNSTSANKSKLADIGITVNSNGTMSLDETKLKAANVSKVQDLFSSTDIMSYGSTVSSRLQFAGTTTTASSAASSTTEKVSETTSSAAAFKADAQALASDALFGKVKDQSGKETDQYNVETILSTVKSFASNYNNMFTAASSSSNSGVQSNLSYLKQKTADNTNALKQFGINVESNGKMSVNEDTFKKADMSEVRQFFKDYGSSVATNASLVDYYMKTQANAANGYTAAGTYNVPGNSQYVGNM